MERVITIIVKKNWDGASVRLVSPVTGLVEDECDGTDIESALVELGIKLDKQMES